MPFEVGDCVVHPAHGVGHVVKLEEKQFFGEKARLYYEVNTDSCTVWVPAADHKTLGLRPLTEKSRLSQYRKLLADAPVALDPDHKTRHQELTDRLRHGSFHDVCEIVRDLTALSWDKPLNDSDATMLRKAHQNLCKEWSISSGISLKEATKLIDNLLQDSQQRYFVKEAV